MRISRLLRRSLGTGLALMLAGACHVDSTIAGTPPIEGVGPISRVLRGPIPLYDENGVLQETRTVSVNLLLPTGTHARNPQPLGDSTRGEFWLGNGTFEDKVNDGPYFVHGVLDDSGSNKGIATMLSRGGDCPYLITDGVFEPTSGQFRGRAHVEPRCAWHVNRGHWTGEFVLTNTGEEVPPGKLVVLAREPVLPNGSFSVVFTLPMTLTDSDLDVQTGDRRIDGKLTLALPSVTPGNMTADGFPVFRVSSSSSWRPLKALAPTSPITIRGQEFTDVNGRPMLIDGVASPATTTASITDLSLSTEPPPGALWRATWSTGRLQLKSHGPDFLVSGLLSLGAPTGGEKKLRIHISQWCIPSPMPTPISRAALVDSRGEVTSVDISCDEESEAVSVALPGEGPVWLSIAGIRADTSDMAVITIRDLAFEP